MLQIAGQRDAAWQSTKPVTQPILQLMLENYRTLASAKWRPHY